MDAFLGGFGSGVIGEGGRVGAFRSHGDIVPEGIVSGPHLHHSNSYILVVAPVARES